jgi:hypothetical protein
MDRYHNSLVAASVDAVDLFTALPWAMLAACPAVTSWTLHPQQLQWFQPEVMEMVGAAASQIKYLAVPRDSSWEAPAAELQGSGRLLWACSRLEEVRYMGSAAGDQPWLRLDPHSTSISTAVPPPLDLRTLVWWDAPGGLLRQWAQQPRLTCSLQRLAACADVIISDLACLSNLRDLEIGTSWRVADKPDPTVSSLSCMTTLTRLVLWKKAAALEAACALTGLQSLSLPEAQGLVLSSSLSSLKQLTHLNVGWADVDLPAALGEWLPRLERLGATQCVAAAVPSSLTRLSWLNLAECESSSLVLPTSLGRLQHLSLSGCAYTSIIGLSSLSTLEVLDLSGMCGAAAVLGEDLGVLRPLTRLQHLDLLDRRDLEPAWCTVLEALQGLTYLDVGYSSHNSSCGSGSPPAPSNASPLSRPLPALKELGLGGRDATKMAALAPWVAQ